MAERVLVTGATGNTGSYVVCALERNGVPVRAACRSTSAGRRAIERAKTTAKPRVWPESNRSHCRDQPGQTGVEYVEFDFERASTFDKALEGVRVVYLVRPPPMSNVKKQMLPFLAEARAKGVGHIVFLSVIGADTNAHIPHHKIEAEVKRIGFAFTFLRADFFFQNFSTTHAREVREDRQLYVPAGSVKVAFVDTRDIGEAAAVCLACPHQHRNRCYTLSGAAKLSYAEVARTIGRCIEREVVYKSANPFLFFFRYCWRSRSPIYALVVTLIYYSQRWQKGDQTNDLPTLLGSPPTSLSAFADDYKEAWM